MLWDTTYDIRYQAPSLILQYNAEISWKLRPRHRRAVHSLAEELNRCGEYGEFDWSSSPRPVTPIHEKGRSTENRAKAKIGTK